MFGWGAAGRLREIVATTQASGVVLVSGPRSYSASGAAEQMEPILEPLRTTRIERSDAYPTLEDVRRGRQAMLEAAPNLIVAVGGGAVLDLAKSIRARFDVLGEGADRRLQLGADPADPIPLIAIPTTAGTGAETTQFSVLYIEGIKHSLDDPRLRPDFAIVDPALTMSVGPRSTAASGLDALAQGIESIWSVASTAHSRRYAVRAVRLALACLERAVSDGAREAREGMSLAAHLSGRAINETRTTASHAASYPMTARHGIPHGHAVALTLPAMLEFNAGVGPDDVQDPSGVETVRAKIAIVLQLLGVADAAAGRRRLLDLIRSVSLETSLAELGIDDLDPIVAEGFNPARAGNNPRRLTPEVLRAMLAGTL
ncbi:MAG: phosphonoacetaldehyde reductase [Candidatus Limnocylindrales bacterium]